MSWSDCDKSQQNQGSQHLEVVVSPTKMAIEVKHVMLRVLCSKTTLSCSLKL